MEGKLGIRQCLIDNKYVLTITTFDDETFDLWKFNELKNLQRVKAIIENDLKEN